MTSPFARVEKQELPESWKVVFDGAPGIPGMDFYEKRVAESIADRFNSAFHARCAPLVEALEALDRELKKMDVVRRYTPFPHNPELVADPLIEAREIARKALEEFRYPIKGYCKEDDCDGH